MIFIELAGGGADWAWGWGFSPPEGLGRPHVVISTYFGRNLI